MKIGLQIQCFGVPTILGNDTPLQDFPAEKVKLLFFYLVLFRQAHARSRLASLFWSDSNESDARHSLNTALWRLRHWFDSLGLAWNSFLIIEDSRVAFNVSSEYWLDIAEFEQRILWARQLSQSNSDEAATFLQQAIGLYRGELLEGCYADWCLAERDRLHRLFLQTLIRLMVYYGGRHEYADAIECAKRVVEDDPLREDIQRELMKLLVLDGQSATALAQYKRCETVLRDELGIEPMPETQQLFQQLVQSRVSYVVPSSTLPSALRAAMVTSSNYLDQIHATIAQLETARQELDERIHALRQLILLAPTLENVNHK